MVVGDVVGHGVAASAAMGQLRAVFKERLRSGAGVAATLRAVDSYAETLATGRAVYYSRSRQKLWRKGEESGNVQMVKSISIDCDADTILLKVEQIGGAACHEGYQSCFFREVSPRQQVVGTRVFDPKEVYKKS